MSLVHFQNRADENDSVLFNPRAFPQGLIVANVIPGTLPELPPADDASWPSTLFSRDANALYRSLPFDCTVNLLGLELRSACLHATHRLIRDPNNVRVC